MISVAAALSACAGSGNNKATVDKEAQATQGWSSDRLYNEAREELNSGNYTRASALYEQLISRQPEGRYVEQSLLETAYAQYKNEEPAKALNTLTRFENNFPGSVNMDYALYLRGLVLFEQTGLARLVRPRPAGQPQRLPRL